MDTARLADLLDGPDAERVSIVMLTITNNAGGGQPVSLANVREVARLAHGHRKKLVLDVARFAENAWFVRERDEGYADTPLADIVRELLADADAVLMSAKKDAIANIGGFVAIREDEEFFTAFRPAASSSRAFRRTVALRAAIWRRSPSACARCSTRNTSATASNRWPISGRCSPRRAPPSFGRSAATRSP
jgi:tryptophanase